MMTDEPATRGEGRKKKMSALRAPTEDAATVLTTAGLLDLVAIGQSAGPGTPLLIRGEPGVGKDMLARLIHTTSARRSYSFIKVNCAVQSVDRLEADLFGHEEGLSAVVTRRWLGSFEFANHGTIYLDEIGALPRTVLPKLIHVVRTGKVSRTGGRETLRVDVRVIASTVHGVETGDRDDLWKELHRFDMVEIGIPPLRQRRDEILLFAAFFLEQFNRRYRRDVKLGAEVIAALRAHSWPGNIRELEGVVRRLVVGGTNVLPLTF
jgi:transcriptional regulator with GAF, ATPase, and Fis domain